MANLLAGIVADTSQVGRTNPIYDQLNEKRRQFGIEQKRKERESEDTFLADTFKFNPSATKYDEIAYQKMQEARDAYVNERLKDPSASREQILRDPEIRNRLAEVTVNLPLAKKNKEDMVKAVTQLKQDHPYIDDTQAAVYIENTQYKDGRPNPNWMQEVDLSPTTLASLTSPERAATYLSKNLGWQPIAEQVEGMPEKGEVDRTYFRYPHQDKLGNPIVEKVLFNNNTYEALTPEVEELITPYKTNPAFLRLANDAAIERSKDPNFNQLDENLQMRIVQQDALRTMTSGLKPAPPKDDDTRVRLFRQERNFQRQLEQDEERNRIARERLNLSRQREARISEADKQESGFISAITKLSERKPLDEVEANTLVYVTPNKSITKAISEQLPRERRALIEKKLSEGKPLSSAIRLIDLSASEKSGKGVLPSLDGSGDLVKVYGWESGDAQGIVEMTMKPKYDVNNPNKIIGYEVDTEAPFKPINMSIKNYVYRNPNAFKRSKREEEQISELNQD